jgi:hypothetical protein
MKILCLAENTYGSCCGHGKYPPSIIKKNLMGVYYDAFSGVVIPRKTRFYLKDKKGYYYLPEVMAVLKNEV